MDRGDINAVDKFCRDCHEEWVMTHDSDLVGGGAAGIGLASGCLPGVESDRLRVSIGIHNQDGCARIDPAVPG